MGEFLPSFLHSSDHGSVEIDSQGSTIFAPPSTRPFCFGRPPNTKATAIAERKAAKAVKEKLAEERRAATASRKAAALEKKQASHEKRISAALLRAEAASSKAAALRGQLGDIQASAAPSATTNPQKKIKGSAGTAATLPP